MNSGSWASAGGAEGALEKSLELLRAEISVLGKGEGWGFPQGESLLLVCGQAGKGREEQEVGEN